MAPALRFLPRVCLVGSLVVLASGCGGTNVTPDSGVETFAVTVASTGNGSGTIVSAPAGLECANCTREFPVGTQLTLTANPAAGSTFLGWTGACSGTSTCSVSSAASVTAMFALKNSLIVALTGPGAGRVASTPAGIDCGSDCAETFAPDTSVTLTATPGASSTFAGWSGGGCSGTDPCVVTVTTATAVVARFELNPVALTVTTTGTGAGTVTSIPAGISCGADCSESYPVNAMVALTAAAAPGSSFAGWSGGCSGTGTCVVTMSAATTVTATFTAETYRLTVTRAGAGNGSVTASAGGINCGGSCTDTYPYNTAVTLTAAASSDSVFAGWSGGGCSGTGTCVVTLTAAANVVATFDLQPVALTVATSGTGAGVVSSVPAGIACGPDCSELYPAGASVTLIATPAAGSTFTGWTGAGCTGTGTCTVALSAATMVTATFTLDTFDLVVALAGMGSGVVTSSPAGINCGATCTGSYAYGTTVTLTATPAGGSIFGGWSGAGCSGTGTCVVSVKAATAVVATFIPANSTLDVVRTGTGAGTVTSSPAGINCGATCSASFSTGSMVTLTATAAMGSTFAGWSGGGCSGTGACVVALNASTSVTASFTINSYALTVARAGTGTGVVTSSPAGINCGATCTATYNFGTVVTLTAAAGIGSTFTGWSGGGCAGTGTCAVTIGAAVTVTATFNTAPSVTYGNFTDLGGQQNISPNFLLGFRVTVTTGGTLQKFGIISRDAGPLVRFALYTNVGNAPGTLVAQTATAGTAVVVGSQELNPTTTATLTAGDYWLMALFNTATNVGGDTTIVTPIDYISLPFANTMPTSFGAASTYNGAHFNYWIRVQ